MIAAHGDLYAREFGFNDGFRLGIEDKMQAILGLDDPFTRLWIAQADGIRVGSIAVWKMSAGTAFLNFVLVDPAFRGQGIAEALMVRAIGDTREHGFKRMRLETYSCLAAARRLYARLGFCLLEVEPAVKKFGRTFDREFWELSF